MKRMYCLLWTSLSVSIFVGCASSPPQNAKIDNGTTIEIVVTKQPNSPFIDFRPAISSYFLNGLGLTTVESHADYTLMLSVGGEYIGTTYKNTAGIQTKTVTTGVRIEVFASLYSGDQKLAEFHDYAFWGQAPDMITDDYYANGEELLAGALSSSSRIFSQLVAMTFTAFGAEAAALAVARNLGSEYQYVAYGMIDALSHVQESQLAALMSCGPKVDATDAQHETALYKATWRSDLRAIKTLLKLGAKPDAVIMTERSTTSPLDIAVSLPDKTIYKLFIASLPSIDVKIAGRTEFHVAADNLDIAAMKFLLKCGADIDAVDDKGNTPLMRFLAHCNPCAPLEHNERGYPYTNDRSLNATVDVITFLIANRANLNARNGDGMTALMIATDRGFIPGVQLLRAAKADETITDNAGRLAIAFAHNQAMKDIYSQIYAK
jgi:hypothetical protein